MQMADLNLEALFQDFWKVQKSIANEWDDLKAVGITLQPEHSEDWISRVRSTEFAQYFSRVAENEERFYILRKDDPTYQIPEDERVSSQELMDQYVAWCGKHGRTISLIGFTFPKRSRTFKIHTRNWNGKIDLRLAQDFKPQENVRDQDLFIGCDIVDCSEANLGNLQIAANEACFLDNVCFHETTREVAIFSQTDKKNVECSLKGVKYHFNGVWVGGSLKFGNCSIANLEGAQFNKIRIGSEYGEAKGEKKTLSIYAEVLMQNASFSNCEIESIPLRVAKGERQFKWASSEVEKAYKLVEAMNRWGFPLDNTDTYGESPYVFIGKNKVSLSAVLIFCSHFEEKCGGPALAQKQHLKMPPPACEAPGEPLDISEYLQSRRL